MLSEIIEGMQILQKYYEKDGWHVGAEHDIIYMYETSRPVSEEDREKLDQLGWRFNDSNGWEKFV